MVVVARARRRVTVRDHGPGVPATRRIVFDRFYRGDGARGRQGSGLGLRSCAGGRGARRRDRGGAADGGGAVFRLRLPVVLEGAGEHQPLIEREPGRNQGCAMFGGIVPTNSHTRPKPTPTQPPLTFGGACRDRPKPPPSIRRRPSPVPRPSLIPRQRPPVPQRVVDRRRRRVPCAATSSSTACSAQARISTSSAEPCSSSRPSSIRPTSRSSNSSTPSSRSTCGTRLSAKSVSRPMSSAGAMPARCRSPAAIWARL